MSSWPQRHSKFQSIKQLAFMWTYYTFLALISEFWCILLPLLYLGNFAYHLRKTLSVTVFRKPFHNIPSLSASLLCSHRAPYECSNIPLIGLCVHFCDFFEDSEEIFLWAVAVTYSYLSSQSLMQCLVMEFGVSKYLWKGIRILKCIIAFQSIAIRLIWCHLQITHPKFLYLIHEIYKK